MSCSGEEHDLHVFFPLRRLIVFSPQYKKKKKKGLEEDGPDQPLSCFGRQYSEGIAVLVV